MANEEHLALLKQGVDAWNPWRRKNLNVEPDLSGADLREADLSGVNFHGIDLSGADLSQASLTGAVLSRAVLRGANLSGAKLHRAVLRGVKLHRAVLRRANLAGTGLVGADLSGATLVWADLAGACLSQADLVEANLSGADLRRAVLRGANLLRANFFAANLSGANLSGANLAGAVLEGATLINTNLASADLTGCRVYGISAWGLKLERAKQEDLIITPWGQPEITVDNLEVAQFIYLLLHNEKIREVIDTIITKAVLILGPFNPPERKEVLDVLREELRQRDRTPIVFDFAQPESKNVTDTVKLLAQMARYVIVDLSDPNSAPYELGVISMLGLDSTPVVPLIAGEQRPFPMLADVLRKRWSTQLVRYRDLADLRANLDEMVIKVAEAKVQELRGATPGRTL